ncbi:MAG: penicillin-binding protein activator [Deltaproteobacteria bacterium]
MKRYRLLAAVSILFMFVLLMGCAKQPFVTKKTVVVTESKTVEKKMPAAEVKPPEITPPDAKKTEVKPAETKPEEAKPADIKAPLPSVVPSAVSVDRNGIGCILPLTGRFTDAGNKALDAVLLSADIFNQRSPSPWKIIVADSGETPEKIKQAVAYLADQANVMAIVAISGTAEATDAALEAQKRQVPLILITSKEGVTEAGDYVFQHFLTPSQQIEALARYALDRLNVAIFSVLYPQDDYGEEMVRLFRTEAKKVGGKVDKAIPYSKTQTDFTVQINKLTGNKIGASEKVYATTEEAKNKLTVDFEALFIPDSAFRVKMITSQLAFYNVKGIKLLGTSLWHSPDLLKKGADYLEGAVLADSFFTNGFLPETNDFVDVYYSAYHREPDNIEALSYDTMELVLGVLEDRQIKTRSEFMRALLAVTGFRGVTGSISFRGSRVAQKDAFILKVENGKLIQVK